MLRKFAKKEEGFTLVELLIVVAIIAILAAIAIPQFQKYRYRAWKGELASDAKNSFTSATAILSDNPTATIDSLSLLVSGGYKQSQNVTFVTGNLQLETGYIQLQNTPLKSAKETKNTIYVFFDGSTSAP